MTPPDTNLKRQTRRHIFPLLGLALVVLIGVGLIAYWVVEEMVLAPAPPLVEDEGDGLTPSELESGDVDVPADAPVREVVPGAPQTTPAPRATQ